MTSDVIPFQPKRAERDRLRVLLADDNADTVLTLSALLKEEGYDVRALNDGTNVAELVRRFDPDVCILDIEMPGNDGYALAHELRDRGYRDRPMLIAISGVWVRPSERVLAIMVGFDHFFQKPADPKELLGVLEDLRQGRTAAALQQRLHAHGDARVR